MDSFLLGDIGGTHSRFALTDGQGGLAEISAFANDTFDNLGAAIAEYLKSVGTRPRVAVLAVAAAVIGPDIALTNRSWRFHLDDLKAHFGFARIRAVNDFEAQAWALEALRPGDLRRIGTLAAAPKGTKAVLGPGTGLGVAALMPGQQAPLVVATEAGHVSFGPAQADEEAVFAAIRKNGRVSAETILSGPGLPRLHAALHPGAATASAHAIVTAALADDAQARATTQLFVRLLGRFAGDIALVFKAAGGVFIVGGVAQALGNLLDDDEFRTAFEAHPPYTEWMAKIPTCLITHPQSGLLGCAVLASHPDR